MVTPSSPPGSWSNLFLFRLQTLGFCHEHGWSQGWCLVHVPGKDLANHRSPMEPCHWMKGRQHSSPKARHEKGSLEETPAQGRHPQLCSSVQTLDTPADHTDGDLMLNEVKCSLKMNIFRSLLYLSHSH